MGISCPSCNSLEVKKNGHIHNGKQNYRCLDCGRQFVQNPSNKIIDQKTKDLIRKALLERVSLEGLCRIFHISMRWLLNFINTIIKELPEDLNATITGNEDFEVAVLEIDEQHSYVGNKKNQQCLWIVLHSATRQIVSMHVGKRTKSSAEALLSKLPEALKKKDSFTQIASLSTSKFFLLNNIMQSEKIPVRQATLKDLTVLLDKDALV